MAAPATFWKGGGSSSRCAESAATASACILSETVLAGCLPRAAAACLVKGFGSRSGLGLGGLLRVEVGVGVRVRAEGWG